MVVKWIISGIAIFAVISSSCTEDEIPFPYRDLCPCLPQKICPRIYGASPEDRKYLGEFLKCPKEDEVRCCGAITSYVVGPVEEKYSHFDKNPEIQEVTMEHFMTTTEYPTTVRPDEEGSGFQEEFSTTTEFDQTTTELPETTTTEYVDRKPKFGDNVEFIYAMDETEMPKERTGRGMELSPEDVQIVMPNLEMAQNYGAFLTTTEVPEEITTETPTTTTTSTTRATTTKQRYRIKVRKNYLEYMRNKLRRSDVELEEEDESSSVLRANRNTDEQTKNIQKSFYARRQRISNTTKRTPTTTTTVPETTTITTTTTTPHPVRKILFDSDVSKRRQNFQRRFSSVPQQHSEESPSSSPVPLNLHMNNTIKVDTGHQVMIRQVVQAIKHESLMTQFDIADELMQPEMGVKIGTLQKMLAQKIMDKVKGRVGVRANLETEEPAINISKSDEETVKIYQQSPEKETKEQTLPFRGTKRFIDTNFLNAYKNVIKDVENKIHNKNMQRKVSITEKPPPLEEMKPASVQVVLAKRRRTMKKINLESTTPFISLIDEITTMGPTEIPEEATLNSLLEIPSEDVQEKVERNARQSASQRLNATEKPEALEFEPKISYEIELPVSKKEIRFV